MARRNAARSLVLLAATLAALAGGCTGGHGKYTKEHLSSAKVKMDGLKSATEWQMGHQAFLAGDLDKALRHTDYSITLNDTVPRSFVLRGRIMLEKGNLEAAATAFDRAEQIDASNVEAKYYKGILAERLNRTEEALACYQSAALLDPSNPQYVIATAETLVDLNRREEARTLLEERRTRFEHSPGVRQLLGQLALMDGDAEKAVAYFGEAKLLAPTDMLVLEDLIHAQMLSGRWADAENNLASLLNNRDYNARRDLKHKRAVCLLEVDRPVEARELYYELTRDSSGSSDVEAWIGLAKISFLLNDMIGARQATARVVAIAPNRAEGHILRALYLRRTGDTAGARTSAQKAVAITRTSESLMLLGMIEQDAQNPAAALACYNEALQLDPQSEAAAQLAQTVSGAVASVPE